MSAAQFTYKIVQYRSGSRFVVNAVRTDTAGSETVFGPDTREACEAFIASKSATIARQDLEARS